MPCLCQRHGWTRSQRNRQARILPSLQAPLVTVPKGSDNRPIFSRLPQPQKYPTPSHADAATCHSPIPRGAPPCFAAAASNPQNSPIVAGWFLVAKLPFQPAESWFPLAACWFLVAESWCWLAAVFLPAAWPFQAEGAHPIQEAARSSQADPAAQRAAEVLAACHSG